MVRAGDWVSYFNKIKKKKIKGGNFGDKRLKKKKKKELVKW